MDIEEDLIFEGLLSNGTRWGMGVMPLYSTMTGYKTDLVWTLRYLNSDCCSSGKLCS